MRRNREYPHQGNGRIGLLAMSALLAMSWGAGAQAQSLTVVGYYASAQIMPVDIAFDDLHHKAFVVNNLSNSVSVFDSRSPYALCATIPGLSRPNGIAIDTQAQRAYVANWWRSQSISIIDTEKNTIVGSFPVDFAWPVFLALDASRHHLYVTHEGAGTISVVDTTTLQTVQQVDTNGGSMFGIAFDPDRRLVYATAYSKLLYAVNADTLELAWTLPIGRSGRVRYSGFNGKVYVGSYNFVDGDHGLSVIDPDIDPDIDPATRAIVGTASLGNVFGFDVGGLHGRVYVAQYWNNQMSVLDKALTGVIGTFGTGSNRHVTTAAIDPSSGLVWLADELGNIYILRDDIPSSDTTPPEITPSIAGTPGLNGWYTSDVTVTWAVTDPESTVTATNGCDTVTVAMDQGAMSYTCTATSDGGTASRTVDIKRDTVTPTTTATIARTIGGGGWYRSDVHVTLTATDGYGSGVGRTEYSRDGAAWLTYDGPVAITAEGETPLYFRSEDKAGNLETANRTVVRIDKTPPVVSVPADITVEATGPAGAIVTYASSASDAIEGALPATCSASSGSTFPIATTVVNCSATDRSGNTATRSFAITVADTTPPAIAPHGNEIAEATSAHGAAVTYASPNWTDAVAGSGTAACLPASGTVFAIGTTTVTCTATDGKNASSSTFTVTVQDTTPPSATANSDSTELWPPNGKMRAVTISGSATDSGSGTTSTGSYGVLDEYGLVQPQGTFAVSPSGVYSFVVNLEASRLGTDQDGRTYLLAVTVKDLKGNATTSTVKVVVPHDQGK